jgi:hypothetical protein
MKLDLRLPTVVIPGAWNPAIFSPEWIGRFVFYKKPGDLVPFFQVVFSTPPARAVMYYDVFGISPSSERVDIYANSLIRGDIEDIESKCVKILNLLPHTPISALGINFQFSEERYRL